MGKIDVQRQFTDEEMRDIESITFRQILQTVTDVSQLPNNIFVCQGREYLGSKSGFRDIKGEVKSLDRRIYIRDGQNKVLRYVDFVATEINQTMQISNDKDKTHACLKVPGDIDLILKFADEELRQMFVASLQKFFLIWGTLDSEKAHLSLPQIEEIINVRLTMTEFADALGMQPSSLLDLAESSDLTDASIQDLEATVMGEAAKHSPLKPGARASNRRNTFIGSYKYGHGYESPNKTLDNHRDSSLLRFSVKPQEYPGSKWSKRYYKISRYFNTYRWQIFWCILYTLVTIGIFVERAFFFARGREHAGLRRMSGAWVTAMIRGSASVIMFTYSSLLVTMCRNMITYLRETFLHRFVPFDSAVAFHKYIAVLAMIGTGVLKLVFKKPKTFNYKSGQWVRIACSGLGENEYHPFTLTSAPHEQFLSLHIRAVGPWTTNLRTTYSPKTDGSKSFFDGPFGEGHQDWYSCEVAVLVGGGIGVTPFASILKDIAFKSKSGIQVTCKKVYFIWVTRTQKSFEWLVDIIRGVEAADLRGLWTPTYSSLSSSRDLIYEQQCFINRFQKLEFSAVAPIMTSNVQKCLQLYGMV
ncbi:Dual oxidase 2 [Bulinus truncatus]|nr:Dual oxidase 2 [Bulinus truncatus]